MESKDSYNISSVRTFFSRLEKLNLDKPSKEIFFFRGHADRISYKLQPSIYRELALIQNEHRLFREIILRCPNDFNNSMTTFEKLVKMQHYKLPTRLLDLTENPLVALFFTLNEESKEDGEVLIFKVPKADIKYYDSDTVSILSNLAKMNGDFSIKKIRNEPKESFNDDRNIKRLLHEIKEDKPYFASEIEANNIESVICVKPKLDNPRIIRQDGAFFLFGIQDEKNNPAIISDAYKVTSESYRLIIKKDGKDKIYKQLADLGIREETMFPEIDYVSKYLKDKFRKEFNNNIN